MSHTKISLKLNAVTQPRPTCGSKATVIYTFCLPTKKTVKGRYLLVKYNAGLMCVMTPNV